MSRFLLDLQRTNQRDKLLGNQESSTGLDGEVSQTGSLVFERVVGSIASSLDSFHESEHDGANGSEEGRQTSDADMDGKQEVEGGGAPEALVSNENGDIIEVS